jgi:hypothetical protein
MTDQIGESVNGDKTQKRVNLPQSPAAFWRAFERAQRDLATVNRQLAYMMDRWRPEYKTPIARATKRLERAQFFFMILDLERKRRLADTEHRKEFLAPRQYRPRPFVEGLADTGRAKDGLSVVRAIQ